MKAAQIAVFVVTCGLTYYFLEYSLKPWMVETLCENLVKCEAKL